MKSRYASFSHGNRASRQRERVRERAICSCIGFYWFEILTLDISTTFFEVVGVTIG